jgi:hypothetical protein
MQAKRWAVTLVCALVLIVGMAAGAGSAHASAAISGHVTCMTETQAVEGIWVAANSGGSGWANWTPVGANWYASFNYTLPNGGSYSLHVGCGGSPQHWNMALYSSTVSGSGYQFYCWDSPGYGSLYLTCTH